MITYFPAPNSIRRRLITCDGCCSDLQSGDLLEPVSDKVHEVQLLLKLHFCDRCVKELREKFNPHEEAIHGS